MNSMVTRVLEMCISVRQFCATYSAKLSASTRAVELLALVAAAIADMEGHATAQDSGKRAAKERTAQKKAALAVLRKQLDAISRTARAMSRTMPGLDDKFRMPRSMAEQACLTTARTFAADAEPLKAELIRRGLPATVIEDLNAAIDAIQDTIDSKAQKTGARVAAGVAVSKAADRGREAVSELNAIVHNLFRDDTAALAEWESASHIERAPRHAKTDAPPAPAQPAPANA